MSGLDGLERSTFPTPELLAAVGHALWNLGQRERAAACFESALREIEDPLARRRLGERGTAR